MIQFLSNRWSHACAALCVTSLLAVVGCGHEERIETYVVPKEPQKAVVADAAPTGQSTDRMLAAVLPEGDSAWFFKIVGPEQDVDPRGEEIETFFKSVRPAAGAPTPRWDLPDDWTHQPASGMRAATLLVPSAGKPLELSVSKLPWGGSGQEMLSNVNRWRGQLQMPPVDAQGLAEFTRTIDVDGGTMTIVDLRGRMGAGGMTPPFAGGAALPGTATATDPSNSTTSDTRQTQLPTGHPPIDSSAAGPSQPSPLTFDTPDGWIQLPASGMRKAALGIMDGDERALVTVIDFPVDAGPMMADPLENVNRWRREVGLAPIAREALDRETESIEIDGVEARYMEAVPDAAQASESQVNRATLAAMVPKGELMWFVKLTGDRDLVARQRDNFQSFLKSLEFTQTGGATHGNE